MLLWLALAALLVWLGLAFAWHGFWRADQTLPDNIPAPEDWPVICALVPARNEADTIANCISSLAAQGYGGKLRGVIVNDSSTDGTAASARAAIVGTPGFSVIDAPDLEPGWAGKLWALQAGYETARTNPPDYYWLSDADIVHDPDVLSRLVAKARADDLALVSTMVRLRTSGFWERLLVPAFILYFQLIYPFRAVNDRASRIAGAAGGCVLIRADALDQMGGFAGVKGAIIDDCTIARTVKHNGNGIWLGLSSASRSLRGYETLRDFWMMVSRSAFTQLHYSWPLLTGAMAGLAVTYIAPPVIALSAGLSVTGGLALVTWLIMSACYWPTVRHHGLPAWWAFTLPAAAFLFGLMSFHSALRYTFGKGIAWKGRDL